MRAYQIILLFVIFNWSCKEQVGTKTTSLEVAGLLDEVEVVRDSMGINHIYAKNQDDLFFTQGYCAAKDRLFQFEIWRRQATGTVAEILGERELKRDIGTRLFKYRGGLHEEMQYYHPDGAAIITAYTQGVNAYIDEMLGDPEQLPVTFKALGILPQKWTPDVVISRHQGLLGNINLELEVGRAVAKIGAEKVKDYYWFHPKDPILELDSKIDGSLLTEDILELYRAYRKPVKFLPDDIVAKYRAEDYDEAEIGLSSDPENESLEKLWIGSNNWVTRPRISTNGHAYMANDPHRRLAVPSLRYWVHLSAPGWNVIGGGEPEIPGISIGHNEYGAWGLTVFRTDGEDLYVYDLNPENLEQYQYQGQWEDMQRLEETIEVKGSNAVTVPLRYTRHGPVTFIDTLNHKAYAVRSAWLEPGGSPYLASLRMDQAQDWEEFRDACSYSHIPGENMVWADQNGNIGWQSVGIAPIRRNFSGMVPVPGDGSYEWDGYLPIKEKPHVYNPVEGFFSTANENVVPMDYTQWDAIGYSWSDPFRGDRIQEVLGSKSQLDMEAMKQLQTDYYSIPAQLLIPYLTGIDIRDNLLKVISEELIAWNKILDKNSSSATIYVAWENELRKQLFDYFPDPEAERLVGPIQMGKLLQWLQQPESKFGDNARLKRDEFLIGTLQSAVESISAKFGPNILDWKYGQESHKHVQLIHPLGNVINDSLKAHLNTIKLPRGGNQYTPGATGSSLNQTHGATFKIIVDVTDWDLTVGTNAPGQSGNPDSEYYKNLYEIWANDGYFPIYFSRSKIEANAQERTVLVPK